MIPETAVRADVVAAELRPVILRLARELRKETEPKGVTACQETLLRLVKRSSGHSLAELAATEGISPAALSRHIDRLEHAGLIERVRSTGDRRRVGLRLTRDGSRFLRRSPSPRTTWLAESLRALEQSELEAIDAAVRALRALVPEQV